MSTQNKTRKGILVKILLAIGIAFIVFLGVITAILLTQKPKDLQISNIDMAKISDTLRKAVENALRQGE